MFYLIVGLAAIAVVAFYMYSKKNDASSLSLPALSASSDNTDYVRVNYPISNAGLVYGPVEAAYNPNDLINSYSPANMYVLPPVPNPEMTRPGSNISEYLNYSLSDSQGHAHTYYYAADRVPDFLLSPTEQGNLNTTRIEEARYHNLADPLLVSRAHIIARSGIRP